VIRFKIYLGFAWICLDYPGNPKQAEVGFAKKLACPDWRKKSWNGGGIHFLIVPEKGTKTEIIIFSRNAFMARFFAG